MTDILLKIRTFRVYRPILVTLVLTDFASADSSIVTSDSSVSCESVNVMILAISEIKQLSLIELNERLRATALYPN